MSIIRKMDALRALAERPGTLAEGEAARAALARVEARATALDQGEKTSWCWFEKYLRSLSTEDLLMAVHAPSLCDCGAKVPRGLKCVNLAEHGRIAALMKEWFPRGVRVYYNYWAYPPNCPGTVTGYSGSSWNWLRIKFDHLKNVRAVPIYSGLGWHLFTEPTSLDVAQQLIKGRR